MWTSSSCSVQPYIKQVRGSLLSGLGIRFQILNLLHFDQITVLKSLSIYLFLLARLNLDLQMDRPPVQASQEELCSEREGERAERARERERGERERRLFKLCRNLPARHCVAGVQAVLAMPGTYLPDTVLQGCRLYKRCRNLPPGTVLQ